MARLMLSVVLCLVAVLSPGHAQEPVAIPPLPAEVVEARYLKDADRFVMAGGVRVRVREEGPADAPAILLLHGFTFSLETWDAWAAAMSTDYRVIRYDLLGHGLTGPDPAERYAPAERAAFVGKVMDALGLDRAVVVGNSLGGLAAWRFASTNPSRVAALVLVAPGAYPINGVGDEPAPVPAFMESYLLAPPEPLIRLSLGQIYADPAMITDETVSRIGDMMRREGNGPAMLASLKEFTLPDPEPGLAAITAPTLILWGEMDRLIPVAQGERMAEVVPGAALRVYEKVGHVPHEEVPAQTAAAVTTFLSAALGGGQ